MQITISNFKAKKSINVEIPDEIFTEAEDLHFIIGTDQYALKSTKSAEDKLREKLAVEFGEENYPSLYEIYPDFGKEGCKTTPDEIKVLIKDKLQINKEKYKALLEDKNFDQLLHSLTSAFANYCVVRERMDKEDKEVKDSTICENVFYDYIERFKKAFKEAKCIKDVHEAIVKIHRYAGIDKRELYGYTFIFACMNAFYEKIKIIETELEEQKPAVQLKDHKLFTDEQYWAEQKPMVDSVIKQFDELKEKYQSFEELTEKYKEDEENKDPFKYYVSAITLQYGLLVKEQNELTEMLKEFSKENPNIKSAEGLPEEKLKPIKDKIIIVNTVYKNVIIAIADIRTKFFLDHRVWPSEYHKTIINANFGVIDFWYNNIKTANSNDKNTIIRKMVDGLILHGRILLKVQEGTIDPKDLCDGKYSNEDLQKIVSESSK